MAQVSGQTDLSQITDEKQFMRFCAMAVNAIVDVVDGGIQFDKNFNSQTVTVTFSASGTDQAVPHGLARTGLNWIVVNKSAACDVYLGATAATTGIIYLRSTVATKVTLVLF